MQTYPIQTKLEETVFAPTYSDAATLSNENTSIQTNWNQTK